MDLGDAAADELFDLALLTLQPALTARRSRLVEVGHELGAERLEQRVVFARLSQGPGCVRAVAGDAAYAPELVVQDRLVGEKAGCHHEARLGPGERPAGAQGPAAAAQSALRTTKSTQGTAAALHTHTRRSRAYRASASKDSFDAMLRRHTNVCTLTTL